jgi:hypothetical protein
MTWNRRRAASIATALGTLLSSGAVLAQTSDAPSIPPPPATPGPSPAPPPPGSTGSSVEFLFDATAAHQFSSSIDGDGDVAVTNYIFNFGTRFKLSRAASLMITADYRIGDWDFSETTSFGGTKPWNDVHRLSLSARLGVDLDNGWAISGGPVFELARESGADLDDSWVAGGFASASYRFSESLLLGGGFGVVSQIEDDVRFFPVIVVNWEITNGLRLVNATRSIAAGRAGLELVFDVASGWEFAVGGVYDFQRFRLDDEGYAPDGVGEATNFPFYSRLSWKVSKNVQLDFLAGITAFGNLKVDDRDGRELESKDYNTSFVLGLTGSIRF